jgi:hypothetical protein
VRALDGFTVSPASKSGDKLTRFGPFSSQCRAVNVKIRRGSWNEELFRVLEGFPDLAHDDEVDAGSGALEMFNPGRTGAIMSGCAERRKRSRSSINPNLPTPNGPLVRWNGKPNKERNRPNSLLLRRRRHRDISLCPRYPHCHRLLH